MGKPWCVNSAGTGSHGGQALSDRSPLFLSDLPDIRTPLLICLTFLPRVVSLFLPLLPFSPGVQLPPQWPSESLPCQAILLAQCQHHQCSRDDVRGRSACFNQPTPYIYLSPIPLDHPSILPCSIKISHYLLNSYLLIWSAIAAYI